MTALYFVSKVADANSSILGEAGAINMGREYIPLTKPTI
ncbi:hypothetical protein PPHE_b0862 [Pseudoalteromonas phenolica O-BC30]|nr:hypothetical protein [Pseudoalteromonas phenolica O-BC30]